ncbi:MAG: RNA polymerase sporulation sigma factor SigE [Clostridia bacterium]|nr:RNA polymerase sporulation sigma factor SigE [Clostridia bacterium]MDE7328340.1 RNA polymerase sporulation sigma factor SigE [Clostridia bacterium]
MWEKIKKVFASIFNLQGESVDYIGGGDALPEPLNQEEEKLLVGKYMQGDAGAKSKLIEHNLRLVVYIAKKFENTNVDIEDLISVGTIGLIKAVNSFDEGKQIKLATYASRCIENEILMHLRKVVKTRNELSLDEPLNVDWEGNVLLLSDVLGTESDVIYKDVENDVEREILIASFNKLPPRERQIVKLRFGILGSPKKTQKEIADMFGISQSYISRLEKKVMKKLKKEMSKMV